MSEWLPKKEGSAVLGLSSDVADAADTPMVGRMRLALAISMMTSIMLAPGGRENDLSFPSLVSGACVIHSVVLCFYSQSSRAVSQGKLVHWLDVLWYGLIVMLTGRVNSAYFLAFFFAILTSSFRWGFKEGLRITIASAVLFAIPELMQDAGPDLPRLLLRTAFLLVLGYMSAYWGEYNVALKRRLALLRDVTRLSNPRFGVDHTVTSVLEKTRSFFSGGSCILVVCDQDAVYSLRTVSAFQANRPIGAVPIDAQAAAPLMAFGPDHTVKYSHPFRSRLRRLGNAILYDAAADRWTYCDRESATRVADLLGTHSYITTPLSLRKGTGRIYITGKSQRYTRTDALFLGHIVAQTFPVIESIELLDRMASEAALQERKKIALDLHDTAIQPYIGLMLGVTALRKKARPDNPLIADIDTLLLRSTQVIGELRRYAGTIKNAAGKSEPVFLEALRRKTAQVKEFYGIDIEIDIKVMPDISDRLSAQVLQLVSEGLSNICKHTVALRGTIRLECIDGWLGIEIRNEGTDLQAAGFVPRSIADRAAALGGAVHVEQEPNRSTAVHIKIPI